MRDNAAKHALEFHWKSMNVKNGKIKIISDVDYVVLDMNHQLDETATKAHNKDIIIKK